MKAYPEEGVVETTLVEGSVSAGIALGFVILAFLASGFPFNASWKRNFSVSGHAYLFLAFAAYFNVYFRELVYEGPNLLPWTLAAAGLSAIVPHDWIRPDLDTLKSLIPVFTLIGCITSCFILRKLSQKFSLPAPVRRAHMWLIVITTLLFLAIL